MRALDLFCGMGGASLGLQGAGFKAIGNSVPPLWAETIARAVVAQDPSRTL
jgi:site-specific DNA-cytosine methylase